jgi:large conductance mechanosensitive channel protein
MELFIDILKDTTIDTVKLIPFLFLTYLAMEYLENKAGQKTVRMLLGAGKKGPVIGGILGVVPQCGFSAAAANLYSGGVITVGTMIAVFLSTSDEMLPILISEQADVRKIMAILIGKIIVGIVAGILVDIGVRVLGKGYQRGLHIHDICEHDHCHCEEGSIVKSALIHSVQILVFIYVISFALNAVVELIGMEQVMNVVTHYPIAGIFLAGLVGLIPNCAASITITKFYLEGVLNVGSMFAGLLSCAGIGLIVLFKTNHSWKKNDRRNTLRNQCSVRNYSGNLVWNVVQYSYMPQKPKRNERSGFEMAKKGFIAEFKEFIARGNVMDLAVGVIIGGAFQSIVNSLVNDMIMPVISLLTGGVNFSNWVIRIGSGENDTIKYGNFITAVINFLLMALVIFCFVKHFLSFFSHKLGKMFIFLIFVKKWCIFYTFLYYFFQFQ